MRSPADAAPASIYLPELAAVGGRIKLAAADAHYALRVCRAREGDLLTVTDGRGAVARLRLLGTGAPVETEVVEIRVVPRARVAWVLCGAPEGERADWLIEKLGELGVAVFQPLDCERAGWKRAPARLERWQRLAIAALRQSRRAHLLEVREPLPLAAALESAPAGRWLAGEDGPRRPATELGEGPAAGFVGPAAGFSPAETAALEHAGARPISLSDGRLRTETAALGWAAWWSAAP